MGSYTSAKGIKTYPSENWLETGSLMPVVTCGGRSTICCSWRATSIQVNCWRKDCTLFCPLALGLNERHLLHLVLRMQNFEVFEPAFCFWVTGLHSQVAVWEHLLSSWCTRLTMLHCVWAGQSLSALNGLTPLEAILLIFNTLSRSIIAFLPRSKCLLISWLQSLSIVILQPEKIKSLTVCIVSPFICHEVVGLDAMILVFWILSFRPAFLFSSFTFIKRLFSSS